MDAKLIFCEILCHLLGYFGVDVTLLGSLFLRLVYNHGLFRGLEIVVEELVEFGGRNWIRICVGGEGLFGRRVVLPAHLGDLDLRPNSSLHCPLAKLFTSDKRIFLRLVVVLNKGLADLLTNLSGERQGRLCFTDV